METLQAICSIIPALHKLNAGKGKNKDEFPVLNTTETNAEIWWNNLNKGKRFKSCGKMCYHTKMDVGSIAIHYKQMSANYKWDATNTKYNDLTKSQKAIVSFVLSKKDEYYSMFPLTSLFKL